MRIKQLRKQHNYTQKTLAKRLCVSRSTVAMWESDARRPDYETLQKLCAIFDVTPTYLLGGQEYFGNQSVIPVFGLSNEKMSNHIISDCDIVDYAEVDIRQEDSKSYFGFHIRGISMEPRMKEGDLVIVHRQSTASDGDTVVVWIGGSGTTVKKIKYALDGIVLIPFNPECEVQCFSAKTVETLPVIVVGKVIELRSKF